jgi:hypothetical protein
MGRYLQGLLIAVCGLTLSGAALRAESVTRGPGALSSLDRFSGRVFVDQKRRRAPSVHYQVLSLAPGISAATSPLPNTKVLNLPLRARGGLVVYELRAGKLTTIIDGRRQERREGEFWVVRSGENIVLEADDDSVVVQTIQITGP